MQYRDFVRRVEQIKSTLKGKKNTEAFGMFINPKLELYKDVEACISVMCDAGMMIGIESIVESWVSTLEHHSSKLRNLSQERLHWEGMLSINGPDPAHCDSIVRGGLKEYFSKAKRGGDRDGHFIRRSENIKSYGVSKAVDRIVKITPTVPFMV